MMSHEHDRRDPLPNADYPRIIKQTLTCRLLNRITDTHLKKNLRYFMRFILALLLTLTVSLLICGSGVRALSTSTITIGETNILSAADGGNGNYLLAQNTTLSQTASIQSLSFYVTQASGNLILGIYDASGPNGGPG